jgi:oligosaccharide reducing-end xylanase
MHAMNVSNHLSRIIGNKRFALYIICLFSFNLVGVTQKGNAKAGYYTGIYPNLFKQAGYSQADIDAKVDKAYHELFEGPNKIYFEVGDSMAYVSDIKNHDARTEGLSYGMMVAVQLNKKDVFDRIWRWSKKNLQHQGGPKRWLFCLEH